MRNAIPLLLFTGFMLSGAATSLGQARGPTLSHEPVSVAVRGQAISILARVKPGAAAIKTVTLYYTPSRDASPIKQPMTPTGGEVYVGTIPTTHLATARSVHYYLEVVDLKDEWAETQWTQVQIRDGRAAQQPTKVEPPAARSGGTPPVGGSQSSSGGKELSTATLIGGGVLAAGAAIAIVAAADSGGGGGGGSGDAAGDTSGGGGDDDGADPVTGCVLEDAVGTWTGTAAAPGYILNADGRAQFFASLDEVPDEGAWGLIDCTLTLAPSSPTNTLYRGSGVLSEDRTSVTINGVTYTKL